MGGKPNPGTKPDKRLAGNKAGKPASKAPAPAKGLPKGFKPFTKKK